jgi:hypothetical protein
MARQYLPLCLTLLFAPLFSSLAIAPSSIAQTQLIETTKVGASFTPVMGRGTPNLIKLMNRDSDRKLCSFSHC